MLIGLEEEQQRRLLLCFSGSVKKQRGEVLLLVWVLFEKKIEESFFYTLEGGEKSLRSLREVELQRKQKE